jgi:NAD(P)-dependent dehydrogenase (short-subunit alcohol dehydrogenase family)
MKDSSYPQYNYKGKVALVTGASVGIGYAAAKAFAEAGAAVVLSDVNAETLADATKALADAGHQVSGFICDVSDEAQAAALVKHAVDTYGRLDMAFNNAGIAGPSGVFTDETVEQFDKVNAINLKGVWTCMKHEIKQMEIQGSGAIVNCSSLGGFVGQAGRTAYHGTKHGVLGLTKSVGLEYAARNIRVNAVCPGVIDTPMFGALGTISPEAMKQVMLDQPVARLGRPEEIADAVLWLCSPGASFVIGAAIPVDGGFTAH